MSFHRVTSYNVVAPLAVCHLTSAPVCNVRAQPDSVHSTVYSIQYTVYSVQSTVYSIQYTVYTLHSTVYTIQWTIYSIQYTVYSVHSTVYRIQYILYSIQYTVYRLHSTVCRAVELISDVASLFVGNHAVGQHYVVKHAELYFTRAKPVRQMVQWHNPVFCQFCVLSLHPNQIKPRSCGHAQWVCRF